jgi:hypothetical protein
MTFEELTGERCDCSAGCLCTRSHEQVCDGQNCSCWCHRTKSGWSEEEMDTIRRVIKEVKEGVETED